MIRIIKKININDSFVKLIIVGDGPEKGNLENLVSSCALQNDVIFVGYQSNPYPFISHSRFLAISSYSEGMPVVAMEAVCLGIPVVSSYECVSELFDQRQCGIIANSVDDDVELENAIRRMIFDNEYYDYVKAETIIQSKAYQGSTMVKKIEKIYLNVLNEE